MRTRVRLAASVGLGLVLLAAGCQSTARPPRPFVRSSSAVAPFRLSSLASCDALAQACISDSISRAGR